MNRFNFKRKEISIQKIGAYKFWVGVFVGLSTAVILSLFFNYGREFLRIFSVLDTDLLMVSDPAYLFYNFFFASLSTALGLSLSVAIWFTGNKKLSRRKRMIKRLSITYGLLIFIMSINFVIRLGSLFGILPYGMLGYEDQLNLINEFGFILFLLPINIFLISWFQTRLVYKTGKWILFSIPICLLIIFTLSKTTIVDRSPVNTQFYYNLYEEELEYINQEIQKAQESYQIEFKEEALLTLTKWRNEDAFNLVSDLKQSFESNKPVSLDSIILSRITVRTLKLDSYYKQRMFLRDLDWVYPSPNSIYQQMENFEPQSPEVYELAKLFGEEIKLINRYDFTFGDSLAFLNRRELTKRNFINNNLTANIYNQADSTRKVILDNSDLHIPDTLLPPLNQNFHRPTFENQ